MGHFRCYRRSRPHLQRCSSQTTFLFRFCCFHFAFRIEMPTASRWHYRRHYYRFEAVFFFVIYLSLASDDTWHPAEKMRTFGRHIFRPLFALQVWHNSRTQFYGEERRGNEIILSETADWLTPRLKCHWNCLRFRSFLWLVGEGRAKIRVTLILFID